MESLISSIFLTKNSPKLFASTTGSSCGGRSLSHIHLSMCICSSFNGQMKVLFQSDNDVLIVQRGCHVAGHLLSFVSFAVSFASLDPDI